MENCNDATVTTNGTFGNSSMLGVATIAPFHHPAYTVFNLLMILFLIAVATASAMLIVVLVSVTKVPTVMKVLLSNQLAAVIFTSFFYIVTFLLLNILVLSGQNGNCKLMNFCGVLNVGYGTGGVCRTWNLAVFSIVVLVIVKFGDKKLTLASSMAVSAAVWVASLLIVLPYGFLPLYSNVQIGHFVDNVACFGATFSTDIPTRDAIGFAIAVFSYSVIGTAIPITISLSFPIGIICYIKHTLNSEGDTSAQAKNGIAKLALFLVLGNLVNLLGQSFVFVNLASDHFSAVMVSYCITILSTLPSPAIIALYFKPVKKKLQHILSASRSKSSWLFHKSTAESPSTVV